MSITASISNSDKINYLNIGLMFLALGVAFYVPFELFLFSYAVLGPGHYLTEISWLQQRGFFSKGKWDYVVLSLAAIVLFISAYVLLPQGLIKLDVHVTLTTAIIYISFIGALAMVVVQSAFYRLLAFLFILLSAFISKNLFVLLSVFLPTLMHVYLFTGFFILYGALKSRSQSGYLSAAIFALCPFLILFINPDVLPLSSYAGEAYPSFHVLNIEAIKLFDASVFSDYTNPIDAVYKSELGIAIMRFIAFAYTYHYLNWFSKTSIIKWHNVSRVRLITISVLWVAAVAFYAWDYKIGFHVLFLLSFLHVFLEFPLNHVTFIGIFSEIRTILTGSSETTNKTTKGLQKK